MEKSNLQQYRISKEELLSKIGIKGEWEMFVDEDEDIIIIVSNN